MKLRDEDCSRVHDPAFVGRDAVAEALVGSVNGARGFVVVTGEAGVGKTTLVRAALRAIESTLVVVWSECRDYRTPPTLGPLVDGLRAEMLQRRDAVGEVLRGLSPVVGCLRGLLPEWMDHLPLEPDAPSDATVARHRVFRALSEVITGLEVDVLVVEDAHWADESTVEFLLHVFEQPEAPRLVITYRPDDVRAGSSLSRVLQRLGRVADPLRVELKGLEGPDIAVMVSSMLGGEDTSQEFVDWMQAATSGVPLLVRESVRMLHDRRDIVLRDGSWHRRRLSEIRVPESVRDAVLERLGGVTAPGSRVLAALAVIGVASRQDVVTLSGLPADQATAGTAEMVRAGWIVDEGRDRLRISHGLVAQAVYEALDTEQRRVLHHAAARLVEDRGGTAAELAGHLHAAGDTERWAAQAELAADEGMALGGDEEAAEFLFEVLSVSDLAASDAIRILDKLRLTGLPDRGRFRRLVDIAHAHLGDDRLSAGERGALWQQVGFAWRGHGDLEAAGAAYARAVPLLGGETDRLAEVMLELARPTYAFGAASEHQVWLDRIRDVEPRLSERVRARIAVETPNIMVAAGDPAGWELAERSLRDPRNQGEQRLFARAHTRLAAAAGTWGLFGRSVEYLDKAETLARGHGYPVTAVSVEQNRVHCDWFTGNWEGLGERAGRLAGDEDLSLLERLQMSMRRLMVEAARGGPPAEPGLRTIVDKFVTLSCVDAAAEGVAALAQAEIAGGNPQAALALTESLWAQIVGNRRWLGIPELAMVRADAFAAREEIRPAQTVQLTLVEALGEMPAPILHSAHLIVRGVVSTARRNHQGAARHFAAASDLYASLPAPYLAELARIRQVRCLLDGGEASQAQQVADHALTALHRLGADPAHASLLDLLKARGLRAHVPGRGGRPSYGDELSPREHEVALLVADGLTNPQIAEQLNLSRQTVAGHVASAMRKLQASSRTLLAVKVTRSLSDPVGRE